MAMTMTKCTKVKPPPSRSGTHPTFQYFESQPCVPEANVQTPSAVAGLCYESNCKSPRLRILFTLDYPSEPAGLGKGCKGMDLARGKGDINFRPRQVNLT